MNFLAALLLIIPFFLGFGASHHQVGYLKASLEATGDTLLINSCPKGKIKLKKGQTLVLKLPVTEGTGYIWQLKQSSLLTQNSAEEGEFEKSTRPSEVPIVGGPSLQVMRFRATTAGIGTVELIYARTFGSRVPAESCTFKVHVH